MNNDTLRSNDLVALEALFGEEFPQTWRDVATSLYASLLEDDGLAALGQLRLAQLAVDQTMRLAQDIGGGMLYMPVGHFFRASAKARKIVEGFRGHNQRALALEHNITESRVRQILDAWQRAQFERRQGKLQLEDVD